MTVKLTLGIISFFSQPETPHAEMSIFGQDNEEIPVCGVAVYETIIKLPPMSSTKYVITATSQSDALSVCNIRICGVGSSLSCVDPNEFASNGTEQHSDGIRDKKSVLDVGYIANLGEYLGLSLIYWEMGLMYVICTEH